jgi:hypothetical protein
MMINIQQNRMVVVIWIVLIYLKNGIAGNEAIANFADFPTITSWLFLNSDEFKTHRHN